MKPANGLPPSARSRSDELRAARGRGVGRDARAIRAISSALQEHRDDEHARAEVQDAAVADARHEQRR